MPTYAEVARRLLRAYRVRGDDCGFPQNPGRLASTGGLRRHGSLADPLARIILAMDSDKVDQVLDTFRFRYGEGTQTFARITIGQWRTGQVRHVGQTTMRLLEVVPAFIDGEAKFHLLRILREETLRRLRQTRIRLTLPSNKPISEIMERVSEVIESQLDVQIPASYPQLQGWLSVEEAAAFDRLIREGERALMVEQSLCFARQLRYLQRYRHELEPQAQITAVLDLPTAQIAVRVVHARKTTMPQEEHHPDDHGLLARWNDLELESRFKAGDVSYPEYVLRNMDQFFSKEEQSELHKIAAMHGLELERQLMEIQIKGRTSEADVQKLVSTLRTLQEKGISADVVSRHETPSGHIEIAAKSRKRFGCLPTFGVLVTIAVALTAGIA